MGEVREKRRKKEGKAEEAVEESQNGTATRLFQAFA